MTASSICVFACAADRVLVFLLNHSQEAQTVRRLPAGTEAITGQPVRGKLTLAPKEVAVIKLTQ